MTAGVTKRRAHVPAWSKAQHHVRPNQSPACDGLQALIYKAFQSGERVCIEGVTFDINSESLDHSAWEPTMYLGHYWPAEHAPRLIFPWATQDQVNHLQQLEGSATVKAGEVIEVAETLQMPWPQDFGDTVDLGDREGLWVSLQVRAADGTCMPVPGGFFYRPVAADRGLTAFARYGSLPRRLGSLLHLTPEQVRTGTASDRFPADWAHLPLHIRLAYKELMNVCEFSDILDHREGSNPDYDRRKVTWNLQASAAAFGYALARAEIEANTLPRVLAPKVNSRKANAAKAVRSLERGGSIKSREEAAALRILATRGRKVRLDQVVTELAKTVEGRELSNIRRNIRHLFNPGPKGDRRATARALELAALAVIPPE